MFKWLIPLTWAMANLVCAASVAPGPIMVLVNFSMATSTWLLRWHDWEYLIVVWVMPSWFHSGAWPFGLVDDSESVLKF